MKDLAPPAPGTHPDGKFQDPAVTAKGEARARVALSHPETLWFNTGTLCNIACVNCYIESSPGNDRLVYLTEADVRSYLAQLEARAWPVREIGFTGGEPFMNPQIIPMLRAALETGREVLVLTNAMRPMMAAKGLEGAELERQARHRVFPGNRPSTTLIYPKLTPEILGQIIALYEHRVFVEGVILGINSFDQWGVELGKELATALGPVVAGEAPAEGKDGSTRALVSYILRHRES